MRRKGECIVWELRVHKKILLPIPPARDELQSPILVMILLGPHKRRQELRNKILLAQSPRKPKSQDENT